MTTEGTFAERRTRLRDALEAEWQFDFLDDILSSVDSEHAFCKVEDAIPCILHGENRMGEKVFTVMLLEG